MSLPDTYRGHIIRPIGEDFWVYADTNELVKDNPERACGHCQLKNTPEGHDGCLGKLPEVMNACCGHGEPRAAYVQLTGGKVIRGVEAVRLQERLLAPRRTFSLTNSI